MFLVFTFHYGPIQIMKNLTPQQLKDIYIPLWSYSNLLSDYSSNSRHLHLHSTMVLFKFSSAPPGDISSPPFTFHYGPIQIVLHLVTSVWSVLFTFHYGPIQIEPGWNYVCINDPHLHSTMVLFKLGNVHLLSIPLQNLHSTMVLFKSDHCISKFVNFV